MSPWRERKRGRATIHERDTPDGVAFVRQVRITGGFTAWKAAFANGYSITVQTPDEGKTYIDYHVDRRTTQKR